MIHYQAIVQLHTRPSYFDTSRWETKEFDMDLCFSVSRKAAISHRVNTLRYSLSCFGEFRKGATLTHPNDWASLDSWQTLDLVEHSRIWLSRLNELATLTKTAFSKFGQFGRFLDFEISVIFGEFGRL